MASFAPAAAAVSPVSRGTTLSPVAITRFTAVPAATFLPAAGFCDSTVSAFSAESAFRIVPIRSPADANACSAWSIEPKTAGTTTLASLGDGDGVADDVTGTGNCGAKAPDTPA